MCINKWSSTPRRHNIENIYIKFFGSNFHKKMGSPDAILVGDFYTLLSAVDPSSRLNVNKETWKFICPVDQTALTDVKEYSTKVVLTNTKEFK